MILVVVSTDYGGWGILTFVQSELLENDMLLQAKTFA